MFGCLVGLFVCLFVVGDCVLCVLLFLWCEVTSSLLYLGIRHMQLHMGICICNNKMLF